MLATRDAFGVQLLKSSQKNNNIIVLSADLSKPTRTEKFAKEFPDRFFEIGIAESNMIGIGLSTKGTIAFWPFKCVYLLSFGFTQIAVSPKIVSGLVVAIWSSLSEFSNKYFK